MITQLFVYLGLALMGGLVLNVMPCVLPVLALKAFHLIEHAHSDRKQQQLNGLAYMLGTVSAFSIFAAIVLAIRASGRSLGWGMQFQHPAFVAFLTALVFAFGLNALGIFEITFSSSAEASNEGFWGSVFNGWFAALMATPCSAPFLGAAAAFALASQAPWWTTLMVFMAIGIGLALPFALLTWVPGLKRVLPRPGPWMETFKQLMGFTLLGAAVWLFGVLQHQVTPESSTLFLGFLLMLAVTLWAAHRFGGPLHTARRRYGVWAFALLAPVLGLRLLPLERPMAALRELSTTTSHSEETPVVLEGRINWAPFDATRIAREHARNRPVFLDFTAEWCATCKTNEKVFLETEDVRSAFGRTGVLPMKADLTNENEELEKWLAKLGRNGIPAYVVVLPDGTQDLLPITITTDTVVRSLDAAARKFPPQNRQQPGSAPGLALPQRGRKG